MAYTVATLIRLTGAKRRTVQFWADQGLIHATKATQEQGPGVHRTFTRGEAIIACLIHPFSLGWRGDQSRSISELREIANTIRRLLKPPVTRADFERAIIGDGQIYLVLTWVFGGGIEINMPNFGEVKSYDFQATFSTLEKTPGRGEVLYLNEWLKPLRDV